MNDDQGPASPSMDFFISYTQADREWAEWLAWTLEDAGYSVVVDYRDFRAGADFILEMQKAAAGTRRTIAVLSEAYLAARYTQREWAAALGRDPRADERTLIPVRVAECRLEGMLATMIYVDLVGLSPADARTALLDGLKDGPATTPSANSDDGKDVKVSISRLPVTGDCFVARDDELRGLDQAWDDDRVHVITLVAAGSPDGRADNA